MLSNKFEGPSSLIAKTAHDKGEVVTGHRLLQQSGPFAPDRPGTAPARVGLENPWTIGLDEYTALI